MSNQITTITLLATSDLHGRLYPYDYIFEKEDRTGSMAQLVTAVKQIYDPTTMILMDGGDTVQDNFAELFLEDDIHPMMETLNDLGYEIWTTGNHEYDFGMNIVKAVIGQFHGTVLLANVYDEEGNRLAKPYVILEKQGVRIAVISMVSPNIANWSETNLKGYTVTNPIPETERVLKELEGKYDVLIGLCHMGFRDELGVEGSGMNSFLEHFPEFDVMITCHEHDLVESREINGVLCAENRSDAKSLLRVTLDLEKEEKRWKVVSKKSEGILLEGYEPDPAFLEKYRPCHERTLANNRRVIGRLMGEEYLAGENPVFFIPKASMEPTSLVTLLNRVLQYYSNTRVSSTILCKYNTNLNPGPVTVNESEWLFPFPNTVIKVKMTGRQLRKFIEYSAQYYNTFHEGDLTITFRIGWPIFVHDIFSGVNYEINIAREPGERIENLTWPDGSPVKDEEEFEFAIPSFRYSTTLAEPGPVLSEEDGLPEMIEEMVRPDLGTYPMMILDYIEHVLNGIIVPENENNWKLTGYSWDEELHAKAIDYLARGLIPDSEITINHARNCHPVRLEHILEAEKQQSLEADEENK